ncbi:type III-A CRISPR-associated protein Cas10/Csm1 [Staphylothermus hellenicus]|nr:HD domain-containing protein [Staphylothermus hellenicus]
MGGSKRSLGYYELLFAALLHDIGKIPQRAGIGVAENYRTHDDLGARLINEYRDLFEYIGLNPETIRLLVRYHHHALRGFKPPETIKDLLYILEKADRSSASERNMGDEIYSKQKSITNYLVSPLWIINYYRHGRSSDHNIEKLPRESTICYKPVSIMSVLRGRSSEKDMEDIEKDLENILRAVNCFHEEKKNDHGVREYYAEIYKDLVEILRELGKTAFAGVMGVEELLETLVNYIRYSFIFVPNALYGVDIPSTNLSSHSILTMALASSYILSGCYEGSECRIRIGLLDLSGIQKFISSYARRKGALRQLRGRSLLLQLVMKASSIKLLKELKLNISHMILERGDSAVFILPETIDEKTFNNAIEKIEEAIYELFHGDIYVTYGLSEPFTPSYQSPWSNEFVEKGFSKALLDLGGKVSRSKRQKFKLVDQSILAKNTIIDDNDDREPDECPLCKATLFKDNLVPINKEITQEIGLEEDIERICPSCLLSHIAGYAAENLVYIIEIRSKDITDKLFEELRKGNIKSFINKISAINAKYGIVPLKGLDTTYIIISDLSGGETGHWAFLKSFIEVVLANLIKKYGGEEKVSIIIYKNNDPGNFIPRGKDLVDLISILEKIKNTHVGFSVIFTNVSLRQNELDDLARVDDNYTLLSWLKIDGDHMGYTGLHLIGSLGRYATFNELVSLYTNLIGHLILYKRAKLLDNTNPLLRNRIAVIYSGGDDSLVIARFVEGLYYLQYYHDWFMKFFGKINGVDALTISAGMILRESNYPSYLSYKEVVQSLEKAKDEGRNRVFVEPLSINVEGIGSIPWSLYNILMNKSLDEEIKQWITNNKQQSYRLLQISRSIVEYYYKYQREKNAEKKNEYYRRIIEYLIAYIYIYNRLPKIEKFIKQLTDKGILTISLDPKTIIEKYSTGKINETLVSNFDKLSRLLALAMLRLREKL